MSTAPRGILREMDHIHRAFMTVYFYTGFITVNFLLCLIYKSNFITCVYVCIKRTVQTELGAVRSFRHPPRVLERIHRWQIGGTALFREGLVRPPGISRGREIGVGSVVQSTRETLNTNKTLLNSQCSLACVRF